MFSNAKIGDKLWSFRYGWGEVFDIIYNTQYPINIRFGRGTCTYTTLGKSYAGDLLPDLYYDEIKFEIPKKPLPKLAVDTKVIVDDLYKRHFSHFNADGIICTFTSGKTSWSSGGSTEPWDTWELAEEEK